MRYCFPLLILFILSQLCVGQENKFSEKWGINLDYSLSSRTHTVVAGPSLFFEKSYDRESGFWHCAFINGGIHWSKNTQISPVTSEGYYLGYLPGVMLGISSQQYYTIQTKSGNTATDIRLSGEVILALFGFIGYRYQHPLINGNESIYISRHAFFLRIPIPLKTISKNNQRH